MGDKNHQNPANLVYGCPHHLARYKISGWGVFKFIRKGKQGGLQAYFGKFCLGNFIKDEDLFLKIDILSTKVYSKNVPNLEVRDFIPAPPRTLSIKQVILVRLIVLKY